MEQQPATTQKVAIRKRTQIEKANRTMFLWVTIASVIVGVCLVAVIFLAQMLIFNEKVLSEKSKTITTLKSNNENIKSLRTEIEKLDTNQSLIDSKAYDDDNAVQVILDALPSDANSLALGASLQTKLLSIPGLSIETMVVDPVQGIESFDANSSVISTSDTNALTGDQSQITFRISVSGTAETLKQALVNLEKSIRTIDVTKLKIESSSSTSTTMTIEGRGYYEPAKTVELEDKAVK